MESNCELEKTVPEVQMRWRHLLLCFVPITVIQYALQKDIKHNPQTLKWKETNYL